MQVLNHPQQTGKFNFTTQFPYYEEVIRKPEFGRMKLGKPVVFDMDMSAGDFLALFYLLKLPAEEINLKVSGTNFLAKRSINWYPLSYAVLDYSCFNIQASTLLIKFATYWYFLPGYHCKSNRVGKCCNYRCGL